MTRHITMRREAKGTKAALALALSFALPKAMRAALFVALQVGSALLLAIGAPTAMAQAWPTKPVRIAFGAENDKASANAAFVPLACLRIVMCWVIYFSSDKCVKRKSFKNQLAG